MIDVLDYLLLDPTRAAVSHFEGNANPLYTWRSTMNGDVNKCAWVKGPSGSPWDIHLVSKDLITLWITEWNDAAPHNYWSDPTCYKKYDDNGWSLQGVAFCPRYLLDSGASTTSLYTPASKAQHVYKCSTSTPASVGDIVTVTHSPDANSNLLIEYFYSGKNGVYQDRERYTGLKGSGLVQWDHSKLSNGLALPSATYTVQQTTIYNKLVPGGAPEPKFPCF